MAWTGHSTENMFLRYRTVNEQDRLENEGRYEAYMKELSESPLSKAEAES
jgi:hypothetical protein